MLIPSLEALGGASALADLEQLLQQWGYLTIFFGMLLENAGLPLPGETITLIGGYAAGNGTLQLPLVIAAAAGGAILGDTIGYWIGRWAGWPLVVRLGRLLRTSPERLERFRASFLRHSAKSVFFGRFIALLRVLAGPMAGAVGMPYPRFLVCNAGGAVLWAVLMVSLASLAGRWIPLERMVQGVVEFGIGALVLVVLLVLLPAWIARLERSRSE